MSSINEIAPDVYRISTYVSQFDLQFNQFLVKDDEPLLYCPAQSQGFFLVEAEPLGNDTASVSIG